MSSKNISRIAVVLSQKFQEPEDTTDSKSLSTALDRIALHATISKSQSARENSNELYWLFYKYSINFIHLVMLWTERQASYNGYLSEWLKIRNGCNLFSYFN